VHNFFKNFKFLVTDTVEHSDGVQKCIRVRLGSGAGGGRGGGGRERKRKNMGGSGWRDDSPFDSRGSSNWSDHVGKFMRLAVCFGLITSFCEFNCSFLLEGVLSHL
jgi:tRNA pseudouridine13 synthase